MQPPRYEPPRRVPRRQRSLAYCREQRDGPDDERDPEHDQGSAEQRGDQIEVDTAAPPEDEGWRDKRDRKGEKQDGAELPRRYASTIASIASATSPARNGIPRTRLKPVASTRNSARTSFCSCPRLISGTRILS